MKTNGQKAQDVMNAGKPSKITLKNGEEIRGRRIEAVRTAIAASNSGEIVLQGGHIVMIDDIENVQEDQTPPDSN